MPRLALLFFFSVAACASRPPERPATSRSTVLQSIFLPPELESRRGDFASAIVEAHEVMCAFARKNGWGEHCSTFDRAELHVDQESLWRRILEIHSIPERPLPTDGLAAGIEGGVLVSVTPEEYRRVRPEYGTAPDAWMRLLAHEMVHRLHVNVLRGNDDAMGPQWFYEGFAAVGSGQNLGEEPVFSSPEGALAAVRAAKGQRGGYRTYAAAVRYFSTRVPLKELVARAGEAGFEESLLGL